MLTKLQAYSSWDDAQTLYLIENGREETDLIQIRNIDGLDPVKATVNTSPFGSVDGAAYIGSTVPTRNIVLTLHPNPDWKSWSFEKLRRLLYVYFMPKSLTRLVFHSDDMAPVEIFGYVEDFNLAQFSSDIEIQISIICPDPYFTALNPTLVPGVSSNGTSPIDVMYTGDIETGFNVEVLRLNAPDPSFIGVQVGDPSISYFNVSASVNASAYFVMNSIPGQRYVQNVTMGSGIITNLLSRMQEGSTWPTLKPGKNKVSVITDAPPNQAFQIVYFERYGGL